jgi:hypothetical protein
MYLGAIDEVAPPALCDGIVKGAPPDRLRAITYPNARHAFDLRSLPERAQPVRDDRLQCRGGPGVVGDHHRLPEMRVEGLFNLVEDPTPG